MERERAAYLICGRVDERIRTTTLMTTPERIGRAEKLAFEQW